jgi:squalene-hopene/tetraprenyl-beta-curcumene cyclase
MKRSTFLKTLAGGLGALGAAGRDIYAQVPNTPERVTPAPPAKDRSLQLEIEHAIDRGLHVLHDKQSAGGFWSSPETPGLSGLVLTALVSEPTGVIKANPPDFVKKGYDYLLQSQQPDGGIYQKGLANYCTSVCMMALAAADSVEYEPVLKRARNFLIGLQGSYPPESSDAMYNGGIGYDAQDKPLKDPNSPMPAPTTAASGTATAPAPAPASHLHYDLSNTSFAIEALHETKQLKDSPDAKDLNWKAAIAFLEHCQNTAGNKAGWVKTDLKNRGGFVYDPLNKKGLGSYGSMSYAGLLSYIYANVGKDDPRVTAVFDWLSHNYTLDENPGMGQEGLFYYYHTMSKGLSAHGAETLTLADGKKVEWASELALKLINLQESDGSWVNSSGRWWEKDPALVTAYAVRTLEMVHSRV